MKIEYAKGKFIRISFGRLNFHAVNFRGLGANLIIGWAGGEDYYLPQVQFTL